MRVNLRVGALGARRFAAREIERWVRGVATVAYSIINISRKKGWTAVQSKVSNRVSS